MNYTMTTDLYPFIGRRIAELRRTANLSQAELAEQLKVATNTVSRWETATYKPSADDLARLARQFRVPISSFFPPERQPEREVEEKTQALLSTIGDLPADDIDELRRYAEFRRYRRLLESTKGRKKAKS
jgi:transcriptional regulator with XRE-family HTH domain